MKLYECKSCNISSENSVCPSCGKRAELVKNEVYYCSACNTIEFQPYCSHSSSKNEAVASDCRPVFPHERALLEILTSKDGAFMDTSMWNLGGSVYLVDGKRMRLSYTELSHKYDRNYVISRLKEREAELLELEESFFDTEPMVNFVKANEGYLNRLTYEALSFIKSEASGKNLDEMFVSFSGGKDSTVVSDLVKNAVSENVIHIYGDTTLEYPTTARYIHTYIHTYIRTPLLTTSNKEQNFYSLCDKIGPPSRMLRWCCTVFKTGSITKKIENTFASKKSVLSFQGMRRLESAARDKYERVSGDSKIGKQIAVLPILDWSDSDVWLYIISKRLPFNDAYRQGFSRVGCWCCPNNSAWSEFLSSIYMADEYDRFRKVLYNFAIKTNKNDITSYVENGDWKKRQGGNGIESAKNTFVSYRPCVFDENSFNFTLPHPIDEFLYTLFTPFGIIDRDTYSTSEDEVFILERGTRLPLLKLKGKKGEYDLKVSVLKRTGAFKDLKKAEQYIKYQINKFQLCVGCTGCAQVCKHNAISIHLDDEQNVQYSIDASKCVGCLDCVKHFPGGCFMDKVLKIRKDSFKVGAV